MVLQVCSVISVLIATLKRIHLWEEWKGIDQTPHAKFDSISCRSNVHSGSYGTKAGGASATAARCPGSRRPACLLFYPLLVPFLDIYRLPCRPRGGQSRICPQGCSNEHERFLASTSNRDTECLPRPDTTKYFLINFPCLLFAYLGDGRSIDRVHHPRGEPRLRCT